MVENGAVFSRINSKIYDSRNPEDLKKRVDKIIACIDYEIDKFKVNKSGIIFTGTLHPSTLFSMASHTKFTDATQGIQNIKPEIEYIKANFGINLEEEINALFYEKFTDVAVLYIDKLTQPLRNLILNRFLSSDDKLISDMRFLLDTLEANDDAEIRKIVHLILQIDPKYQVFRDSHVDYFPYQEAHIMSNINTKELNLDFIDYAVQFIYKIYQQAFGKKDSDVEEKDTGSNRP